MKPLPGWDGPLFLTEEIYRYSKTISWIRLYIDVVCSDFFGGTCAASVNYEVDREDCQWKRFETDLAKTQKGELVLRFRGYATWDVVYERIGEGALIDSEINTIEDLAAYLERCIAQ
jgi:hypothetical protein